MDKIRLMGHHIKTLKELRKHNNKRFSRWLHDKIYEKGSFDSMLNWARSLTGDTLVEIIYLSGRPTVDSLCEQGCPYYTNCSRSVWETLSRILKEKPLYFPLVFIFGFINSDRRYIKKSGLAAGAGYTLDYILNRK